MALNQGLKLVPGQASRMCHERNVDRQGSGLWMKRCMHVRGSGVCLKY